MESIQERLNRLREERVAREKARLDKLRELNLKKYTKSEPSTSFLSSTSVANRITTEVKKTSLVKNRVHVKNNFYVNGTTKKPITAPTANERKHESDRIKQLSRPKSVTTHVKNDSKIVQKIDKPIFKKVDAPKVNKIAANIANIAKMCSNHEKPVASTSSTADRTTKHVKQNNKVDSKVTNGQGDNKTQNHTNVTLRKSMMPPKMTVSQPPKSDPRKSFPNSRKSMLPVVQSISKVNPNRQSVFERLYQPKIIQKPQISDTDKLKTDPNYLKKVIRTSSLILNKRHTLFEPKKVEPPVRRSISAVHFKRISSAELKNCIHKWSSIGEKLDKAHLQEINEDASVKEDKIVSAIKSERKKVKFATSFNFNTPKPEELQMRLQSWLQKRGKSLDSYHHLQCFGIHHLAQQQMRPLNIEQEKFDPDFIEEDEDKENVPLESDSDNESFTDIMNEQGQGSDLPNDKQMFDNNWRCASVSDSIDFNDTRDTTLTSTEAVHHVDDLLLGALNDLTELLREGFDWEQCARWLRAIRQRFPSATDHAAYWECRAALEERRGDLASSVECWEEAIAKGTERSVVEANLDQLLDKFMQLKISPNSGNSRRQLDPKMLDIKNVFKSTLIRFAVQQAKLRQSQEPAKYTVTPVRRSARLSAHWSGKKTKTPLQVCSSVKQAGLLGHPLQFVPNHTLADTP